MLQISRLKAARAKPSQWIENRISFHNGNLELSLYDTYEPANRVPLSAEALLFCGMLQGKKIMHQADQTATEFLPCESFVMAPGQTVHIDFPEAQPDHPTTCMALHIDQDRIEQELARLNQTQPRHDEMPDWQYTPQVIHTTHGAATQQLLERLVTLFCEPDPDRSYLIDLAISELIVRMLRHQTRALLIQQSMSPHPPQHSLNAALKWLEQHAHEPFDPVALTRVACISRPHLYRLFRQELGCTPQTYQQQLRIKAACRALMEPRRSITQIAYDLGFATPSHFSRQFRQSTGISPSAWRSQQHMPNTMPLPA